jgi:very-short-patch-repair endonuclease
MRAANEIKTGRARRLRRDDLICRDCRLIIQVDGGQHADNTCDAVRDKWLTDHNDRVPRFWNNDVLGNMAGVLETITTALAESAPHPDR